MLLFSHHLGPDSWLMLPIKMEVAAIASSLTTLAYNAALESTVPPPNTLFNVICSWESPLKPHVLSWAKEAEGS